MALLGWGMGAKILKQALSPLFPEMTAVRLSQTTAHTLTFKGVTPAFVNAVHEKWAAQRGLLGDDPALASFRLGPPMSDEFQAPRDSRPQPPPADEFYDPERER
jgi:hypothetical protein